MRRALGMIGDTLIGVALVLAAPVLAALPLLILWLTFKADGPAIWAVLFTLLCVGAVVAGVTRRH